MQAIQGVYSLLTKPKNIVITTHQKPDGDAMGSSLGLYHFLVHLGHKVQVISPTNWASFLNWMPAVDKVIDFEEQQHQSQKLVQEADIIFCLDFNTLVRLKHFGKYIQEAKAIKVLIDHHQQPQIEVFSYGESEVNKSSTCEMVYDFIVQSPNASLLNKTIAECLYTGVMTDTGSFRFASTTASVHKMIAQFKDLGLNHTQIHDNIFDNFLENRLRFIGHCLLNRMEVIYEYNTALFSIPKGDLLKYDIKTGDTEGLVNYLQTIKGIKLAAIVIDRDEERKWSFRSKGNFDVNEFARKHFEGGGHKNASGGRSSSNLQETVKHFYTVIKEYEQELNTP